MISKDDFKKYMEGIDSSLEEYEGKIDSKLSLCIDQFLSGERNDFLSYNDISKIIEKSQSNSNLLSIGYGYIVDKNLNINHANPIDNNKIRIDYITPNDYNAFLVDEKHNVIEVLDVEKKPFHDINRITVLQEYFGNYLKEFKGKSLKRIK